MNDILERRYGKARGGSSNGGYKRLDGQLDRKCTSLRRQSEVERVRELGQLMVRARHMLSEANFRDDRSRQSPRHKVIGRFQGAKMENFPAVEFSLKLNLDSFLDPVWSGHEIIFTSLTCPL